MKTEQELKDQCTPELIKWMWNLTHDYNIPVERLLSIIDDKQYFPLLIHRAVEGWNKKQTTFARINIFVDRVEIVNYKYSGSYKVKNYQPQSLTHAECAMLHCLLDIFKEERE